MRVFSTLFLIIVWTFLILVPLKVYADDVTFTCKPVVAGMPKKDGNFYVEDITEESTPMLDVIPDNQLLQLVVFHQYHQFLDRKYLGKIPAKFVVAEEILRQAKSHSCSPHMSPTGLILLLLSVFFPKYQQSGEGRG